MRSEKTWLAVVIRNLLRSNEHQTALTTSENRVVRRHKYWKAFAVLKTVRLTAIVSTFHVFQLLISSHTKKHALIRCSIDLVHC